MEKEDKRREVIWAEYKSRDILYYQRIKADKSHGGERIEEAKLIWTEDEIREMIYANRIIEQK